MSSAWQEYKNSLGDSKPWHLLNKDVPMVNEEEKEKRLDICASCPEFIKTTNQCKKCGCFMNLKTRLESATCPLGKW